MQSGCHQLTHWIVTIYEVIPTCPGAVPHRRSMLDRRRHTCQPEPSFRLSRRLLPPFGGVTLRPACSSSRSCLARIDSSSIRLVELFEPTKPHTRRHHRYTPTVVKLATERRLDRLPCIPVHHSGFSALDLDSELELRRILKRSAS